MSGRCKDSVATSALLHLGTTRRWPPAGHKVAGQLTAWGHHGEQELHDVPVGAVKHKVGVGSGITWH